jgi:transcriptional regulator with GAF, ATPase, and Fis domain
MKTPSKELLHSDSESTTNNPESVQFSESQKALLQHLENLTNSILDQIESLTPEKSLPTLMLATKQHSSKKIDLKTEVENYEANLIRSALQITGGNQREAARLLGVKASNLNHKIRRYKIASRGLQTSTDGLVDKETKTINET